ncbi:hypothetical protein Efla_004910 [Eimeria flavescens]
MGGGPSAPQRGTPAPSSKALPAPSCPVCRPQQYPRGPPLGASGKAPCGGPGAPGTPSGDSQKGRCSGRIDSRYPPAFSSKLLHAVESQDAGALSSLLQQHARGPSKADTLAFEGDAGCLHALLAALQQQQQQQQVLEALFEFGCSVDSQWPAASFFRGPQGAPSRGEGGLSCPANKARGGPGGRPGQQLTTGPPADPEADEGAPSGVTHLCVQWQPSAAAAAGNPSSSSSSSSSSALRPRRSGQTKGPPGAPPLSSALPAVLQPPRGPTSWGWGPLSEVCLFCQGTAAAGLLGQQQQKVLQQLKEAPLLLVAEVGLLYSSRPEVHMLVAELTRHPGRLLVAAAAACSPSVLQRLLQRGANPNFKRHGLSALGVAACCSSGAKEKAQLLLAFGGSPEGPLSAAAAAKGAAAAAAVSAAAAQRLAAHALKRTSSSSSAAAAAAARLPSLEALEAAAAALGPPVTVAPNGETPVLLQAAACRNISLMELLLDNGASPDVFLLDSGLPTPLFFCVFWGITRAVRLLLDKGANPFLSKETGEGLEETARRALQFAAMQKPRHIRRLPLPNTPPAVCEQVLKLVETAQQRWASAAFDIALNSKTPAAAAAAAAAARGGGAAAKGLLLPSSGFTPGAPLLLKATWESSLNDIKQLPLYDSSFPKRNNKTSGSSRRSSSTGSSRSSSSSSGDNSPASGRGPVAVNPFVAGTRGVLQQGAPEGPSSSPRRRAPRGPSVLSITQLFEGGPVNATVGPPTEGPPHKGALKALTGRGVPVAALPINMAIQRGPHEEGAPSKGGGNREEANSAALSLDTAASASPAARPADPSAADRQQQQDHEQQQQQQQQQQQSRGPPGALGGPLRRRLSSLENQLAHLLGRKQKQDSLPLAASGGPQEGPPRGASRD